MASVPGVIGGQLAGVIRTRVKIEPEDVFHVKLSCVNCVGRRNSKGRISRKLIWQDELDIAHDLLQHDAHHSAIPVLFQIPYECRPTDEGNWDNTMVWSLEVTAKTPGLDYCVEFEVPVFKTTDSDPDFVVDRGLVAKYTASDNPNRDLRDAGVVKRPSFGGDGWQFVFPMARHSGCALGFTLGSLVCFGASFGWPYMDFQWLTVFFGVVCGLFGLLLFGAAMNLWFNRSAVDVSPRGMTVTGGLFGCGSRQWIEAAEVIRMDTACKMKSEKNKYFNIIVVCRGGKRITAGKWLLGKRLVTAVIHQIEQAMGKPSAPDDV